MLSPRSVSLLAFALTCALAAFGSVASTAAADATPPSATATPGDLGSSSPAATAAPSAMSTEVTPSAEASPATSTSTPAASPTAAPSPRALIVAPVGFHPIAYHDLSGLKVKGEWIKLTESHDHTVLVGTIYDAAFVPFGNDISALMPPMIKGIRESTKGYKAISSGAVPICHGHTGYLVKYAITTGHGEDVSILFALSNGTVYEAFYEHDITGPGLPEGLAAVKTLCPPEASQN